jgi:hypothetical protein
VAAQDVRRIPQFLGQGLVIRPLSRGWKLFDKRGKLPHRIWKVEEEVGKQNTSDYRIMTDEKMNSEV